MFVPCAAGYGDSRFRREDDGAAQERVRTNRRHGNQICGGVDDGTSCGKGIGGGAGRRGDDEPVRPVSEAQTGVSGKLKFRHSGTNAGCDDDIVENALTVRGKPSRDLHVEHHALLYGEVSGRKLGKPCDIVSFHGCEKAEMTEIDTYDGL